MTPTGMRKSNKFSQLRIRVTGWRELQLILPYADSLGEAPLRPQAVKHGALSRPNYFLFLRPVRLWETKFCSLINDQA